MLHFLTRRAGHSAVSLMCLIVLVFFLARLTGNPADLYLEVDATAEMRAEFMRLHGLDQPVWEQFGAYFYDLVRLDLGRSISVDRPVLSMIGQALPTTLTLAFFAMSLALTLAIVIGSFAAFRTDGLFDRVATILSFASASIPSFWLAMVAILFFAVQLRLLPTSGGGGVAHWIMPVVVLAVRPTGLLVQLVRVSMTSALTANYVQTAKARGIADTPIIFVHALRNALLPVVTVAGDEAAGMINGAIMIELVFNLPGMGSMLIQAIKTRDFALIQGTVMVTALAIFVLNLMVDLIYVALDPRIRH